MHEFGWGGIDVHAAEPLVGHEVCNCCHEARYHRPECILCHCGGYVAWGSA